MPTKSKIVIFGGSGYIGNAVSEFMKNSYDVTIADVRPPKSTQGLRFVNCDVRDSSQVREVVAGASAVFYFSIIQIPQINTEKRLGYEVNVLGLQNVCEAALRSESTRCAIQSGTWHVFGERGLSGVVDESFGFRPDNVEERAKIYALCKIAQESIMRLYDEMGSASGKTYGVMRMGTVLGEGMPEQTAAALFIKNGLKGDALTPYMNSMYRPMLYVDIQDICRAYANFVKRCLDAGPKPEQRPPLIVNLVWPEPMTILELAEIVRDAVKDKTHGKIIPAVVVKDTGAPASFSPDDKTKFKVDPKKATELLGGSGMTNPRDSIARLVEKRIQAGASAVR